MAHFTPFAYWSTADRRSYGSGAASPAASHTEWRSMAVGQVRQLGAAGHVAVYRRGVPGRGVACRSALALPAAAAAETRTPVGVLRRRWS
ncbi:hypothetical protein Pme01_49910 [Planosporangium mesophilum]|uniref:Uncharacterized protein n=1 Tax=Planosporangium mesophilum TaxID=689768 RepID=A0A8J3TIR2_9ACTN|nr:hypothetical protein Pme01_49910 [Planosporangium mesophilum]